MRELYRTFVSVAILIFCALTVSGTNTGAQQQDDLVWRIGDIFAGVGFDNYFTGEYWVFDPSGAPKMVGGNQQTVVDDPTTQDGSVTTGCMVAPNGMLYTTSGYGNTVSWFAGPAEPHDRIGFSILGHTASVPNPRSGGPWSLFAIESIVFDAQGNYYVGGQGDPPVDTTDYWPNRGPGFIFKFGSDNALKRIYEVPSGRTGVDQIDLGSDSHLGLDGEYHPTIYYTSEDTKIRIFKPWLAPPFQNGRLVSSSDPLYSAIYGAIQVLDSAGQPQGGSMYAVRALPPDISGAPSGFLVATNSDVLRIRSDGTQVRRFSIPAGYTIPVPGERFALNITPDGGSFWTATYPGGNDYPLDRQPAHLIRYHIPTGSITAHRVLEPGAVWGLCVVREYTAGINTCYVTDDSGRAIDGPDADSAPDTKPCPVPAECGLNRTSPECRVPGAPGFTESVPDQINTVWDAVTLSIPAAAGGTGSLTYAIIGSPPMGLSFDPIARTITGVVQEGAYHQSPVTVTISAADGNGLTGYTSFKWTILAAPVARDDHYSTVEDVPLTILLGSLFANDTGLLTPTQVEIVSGPSHGSVSPLVTSGGVTYTPVANFVGEDSFLYRARTWVTDLLGERWVYSNTVRVTIDVTPSNDPPVADDTAKTTSRNVPVSGLVTGSDPDGDALTFTMATGPSHGSVTLNANGSFTYIPAAGYVGPDSFTFSANDGHGGRATGTVTIQVLPNSAPVCTGARPSPSLIWPPNHKMVPIKVLGVTDQDGDPITIEITGIFQDEPVKAQGSGATNLFDGAFTAGGSTAYVRSERTGVKATPGNGRIYEILFTARDGAGGSCSGWVSVGVPHDKRKNQMPMANHGRWNSLTGQPAIPPYPPQP